MQRRTLAASMLLGALVPRLAMPQHQHQEGPVEVAGVKFERTVRVGAHTVSLNGAGIRWKAVFKVYAAALYTAVPMDAPETVLASTGAKRIHLVMLRSIDANELGKVLADGIEKNASREEFVRSLQSIIEMGQVASAHRTLEPGQSIVFDWMPGSGTTLYVKGKAEMGPVAEPAFFSAMTKIWLGKNPADAQLKDALLGRQPEARMVHSPV